MDWDAAVVAGITGLAAIAKVLLDRGHWGGTRARIRHDLDLLERMPDGEAKEALRAFVDRRVLALLADEQTKTRDPTGIVLGLTFIATATWMAVQALSGGSALWWFGAVPIGLLGIVGFSQDVVPRERDERGRVSRRPS